MIERFSGENNRAIILEALSRQRLIRGNDALAASLVEQIELLPFNGGQKLIEQGADDSDVYFLIAGHADIIVNGRKVAERGPGDCVGEVSAILPHLPRSATVLATENGVVAKVSAITFRQVADEHPSLWREVAKISSERLFQRNALVNETHSDIRAFVISSLEALPVAQALQEIFMHDTVAIKLWTDGVFRASQYSVDSLVEQLDVSDFAIAIVQPDDLTEIRGEQKLAPRDNVLFELGLFIGRLGRHRTFLLEPTRSGVKLPSDLSGITTIPYKPGKSQELLSLLGPACNQLRRAFKELGPNN